MDIPFFLVKSKTGLLIQMIHNGGAFFGSYPKWDTLDTRSEEFLYYGSEKEESVGRLYEWKITSCWYIVSFLKKNPNNPDFLSDLEF